MTTSSALKMKTATGASSLTSHELIAEREVDMTTRTPIALWDGKRDAVNSKSNLQVANSKEQGATAKQMATQS